VGVGAEEEVTEHRDGIGQIDTRVAVEAQESYVGRVFPAAVATGQTVGSGTAEQKVEEADGIADVELSVLGAIAGELER